MAEIKVLDQYTIDHIAAGEVVERPSSVVKELVENAIDAKAGVITVEIKEGGIKFIRVTDNGIGIEPDQIPTAFLRHATSKIREVKDLMNISSLGFRGEALSSIAAVGKVELISKTPDNLSGIRYEIHGGKEIANEEIGAPEGTTFIVRELFYNVPARRKFLKTAMTEASYIENLIRQMAMSHPEIAFKFVSNNQNKLSTPGNGNLQDVIYHIYGRDIAKNLLPCKANEEHIKIDGYVGKPIISRGNRAYENYFVNGRYIKSAVISRAIEDAYKTFNMQHKYPFTALMIEVPMDTLDVNVHPTKMEVRFTQAETLYRTIYQYVREALLARSLMPKVTLDKQVKKDVPNPVHVPEREPVTPKPKKQVREITLGDASKREIDLLMRKKSVVKEVVDVNPNKIKHEIREEIRLQKSPKVESTITQKSPKVEMPVATETPKVESVNTEPVKVENPQQMSLLDQIEEKEEKKAWKPKFKIIGQLFATYWLMELDNTFYIMDQHAAHEKVNYEKMMAKLAKKEIYSQQLAPPLIISLNMKEAEVVKQYADAFASLGFVIEEFGGKEYCIRAVPANLFGLGEKDVFIELLDSVMEEGVMTDMDMITDKIASMACKASIKGNQKVSLLEVEHLLEELMECENPYTCPHGRPTMISMTKSEIEKKFKRIV